MRSTPSRRRHRQAGQRQSLVTRLLLLCGVALGLGLILYPTATTWVSDQAQASQLASYSVRSASLDDAATKALLDRATEYNAHLPYGTLHDPYSSTTVDAPSSDTEKEYESELRIEGLDVMSQVTIPSIDLSLPVFHGTSPQTLDKGAGHLFGSSLPVGGPGTHSVLTAHSGLVEARMFTDLGKVAKGDVFTVTTLGQALYYRVDQISIVTPDDISSLTIVPGKDYVTLVTCTPIHVNSHRLLVRGERIPAPPAESRQHIAAAPSAPFPWWIAVLAASLGSAACYLFLPRRQRRAATPAPSEAPHTSRSPMHSLFEVPDPSAPTQPTAVQRGPVEPTSLQGAPDRHEL